MMGAQMVLVYKGCYLSVKVLAEIIYIEIFHRVLLPLPQWVGAPPGRQGVILLWSTCQVDANNDCKQHNHIEFCVRAGWSNNPKNVPHLSSFIFCSFVER